MTSLKVTRLGDVATIVMGQSPPGESYNTDGVGLPLLNGPTEFGSIHPVEKQWTTRPTKICEAEDILFCVRGATAGRLNVADKPYCLGRGLGAVRPKPGVFHTRFLHHVLRRGYTSFQQRGVGSTFINISGDELANFEVPTVPLPEQARIADILDRADAMRAKRRDVIAQANLLPQSVFSSMFGGGGDVLSRWPLAKLGDRLDFLTSGSRGWAEHYAEAGDLFLRIQNVRRDELVLDDVAFVRAPATAEAKRTRVQDGDVLLSITADLGRSAVVQGGLGPAYINQHLCILRSSSLEPRFLSAYLASPAGQRQVLSRDRNAVKAGLNFDDIRSVLLPLPPRELQLSFVRGVAAVDTLAAAHRASLAEMDALFASLQHRAFRGEL